MTSEKTSNDRQTLFKMNWSMMIFYLSLALVLIGNIGAYYLQTDGGNIDVMEIKIPTENGQWVTANLFKPVSATVDNKAPAIVVCPGFQRSKETLANYSIELARRGMVVITIDPYNQGASSSSMEKQSATREGYGIVAVVEYIYDTPNLNYIDKTKIGATGYSAGGNAALASASIFGKRYADALDNAANDTERDLAKSQSKLAAIFIGGYVRSLTDKNLRHLNANVGMDYAFYDEGSYRNANKNADMRNAPEALRLVNSIFPKDKRLSKIEIGKIYGNPTNRTMRVVHNTRDIHPLMTYTSAHVSNLVNFFTTAFDMKPALPASNQIWMIKELFNLLSFLGALLFIVPCAALLLRVPVFRSLAQPVPRALPMPNRKGKIIFWSIFAVSAAIACYLFVPCARATSIFFPTASSSMQTWWFPQSMNNAVLLWAVANGTIGLIVFFLNYHLFGKKSGVSPDMWGIRTNPKELFKTLCLALTVFGAFYSLLFASYAVFHTDFRFYFVAASADFPAITWLVALEYLPLFFIFYLGNSIRVNSASRFDGQKEWISMLIMGLGNSVGLMAIVALQYTTLAYTGTVFWTTEWLYIDMLYGIIPMMFILPYFNRYLFRLSGKVYLGPAVTCLIFIMMLMTDSISYNPLR